MLTIEIEGLKELNRKFNRLDKNLGKTVVSEISKVLVQNLKSNSPFWHGELMRSIQSRPTKDGSNIHILDYGAQIETGFYINRLTPLLEQWSVDKLIRPNRFIGMIRWFEKIGKSYYSEPSPWIQPSIDQTMGEFDTIAKDSVNNAFKEAGL